MPARRYVSQRASVTRKLLCFAAAACLSVPAIQACSWSYLIWALRSKTADPLFRFVRDGKAGYIDSTGKVIIQPSFPAGDNFGGEFHEGLLAIEGKEGFDYVDHSGKVVFHVDTSLAFDFSEGLAPARSDQDNRWGFIDRTGRFAIPPQYFWVDPFSDGLARVSVVGEVGSTGYIDSGGQFVISPKLSYAGDFQEGRAAAIIGGPCRLINGGSCGRPEFRPALEPATYDCRYAIIDKKGEPVSDLRFDDVLDFSEGVAPVRIGRAWGYVDRSGRISISPRFQSAEPFSEGLAAVGINGKIGFIDHSGAFVIAPRFTDAEGFSDGRALVTSSQGAPKWSYIEKTGKLAFPGEFVTATSFNAGLAHVAVDAKGRFAWINTSGKRVFSYARQ